MNIIKRSGEEAPFDRSKIVVAISKANATVDDADKLTEARIQRIAQQIEDFAVRRVVLALEGLYETIRDIFLRHRVRTRLLDLRLHQILDLLHAQRAVMRRRELLDLLRDALDARLRQLVRIVHRGIRLPDGDNDF